MYKKVMWATDGSEAADRALVHAKALAAEGGHSVTVVYCEEFTPCPVLAVPPEHSSDG